MPFGVYGSIHGNGCDFSELRNKRKALTFLVEYGIIYLLKGRNMSVKSKLREIKLNISNPGQLEADHYVYHYNIFNPVDLESDQVISSLLHTYIRRARKNYRGGPFFLRKNNIKYKAAFRTHVINEYQLTDAQLEGGTTLTPEQIQKFRGNLTKHLHGAYKRAYHENANLAVLLGAPMLANAIIFGAAGHGLNALIFGVAGGLNATTWGASAYYANRSAKDVKNYFRYSTSASSRILARAY